MAAEQAGSADDYKVAAVADLPFADDTFDLAIAYNVLMDIEDVPTALREIGRVLRPSGTLVISIVHPFADRGRFVGPEPDAPFVLHNSYFGRERFEGVEERNGLQMHFAGWSQPLESYMLALEGVGFAVSALREPVPDASEAWTHMERWSRIPLFLWLKARPLPGLEVRFVAVIRNLAVPRAELPARRPCKKILRHLGRYREPFGLLLPLSGKSFGIIDARSDLRANHHVRTQRWARSPEYRPEPDRPVNP